MNNKDTYQKTLLDQFIAGTISDADRHVLEKMALDDSFLFDAMEGYSRTEAVSENQIVNIHNRIRQKKSMSLSAKLAIAASVLILIIASIWVSDRLTSPNNQALSENAEVIKPDADQSIRNAQESSSQEFSELDEQEEAELNNTEPTDALQETKITEPLDELLKPNSEVAREEKIIEVSSEPPTPSAPSKESVPESTIEGVSENEISSESISLDRRSREIKAESAGKTATDLERSSAVPSVLSRNEMEKRALKKIVGSVFDHEGNPILGAVVTVMDGDKAAITDTDGFYQLDILPEEDDSLTYSYIGFRTIDIPIDLEKDQMDIKMEPAEELMDEVIIIANGNNEDRKPQSPSLEPIIGKTEFRTYVNSASSSANCPDSGKIRMTFEVDPSGNLSNFKITRSLNPKCDQLAIDIVKNGGAWINQFEKTKKVRYTINF